MSLLLLAAVMACQVYGQVQSSTPCSLSIYRYLYNLPGEKIRPLVPEGTYIFGKRVGPPQREEGQASNVLPAVLKPEPSYNRATYLPPPVFSTTTRKPSTSAPIYIPPPPSSPSPNYPTAASNTITVVEPLKPSCKHPGHKHPIETGLVPPYQFVDPAPPQYQQPQPTFVVPQYEPVPQKPVTPLIQDNNDIQQYVSSTPIAQVFINPYPVPTSQPQFIQPYIAESSSVAVPEHKTCEKHRPIPTTTTTTTTTTTPEPVVETRQNEIVILPEPHHKDCPYRHQNVQVVAQEQVPSASAGYSYDAPAFPLGYPSANTGYAYPKGSPTFDLPSGYPFAGQVNFESEKKSSGTEDRGDLVVLKV